MFWYMQRDQVDKKLKRLQSEADRCMASQPDFSSAHEIIQLQKNAADEEKSKYRSRLQDADDKLRTAVTSIMTKSKRWGGGETSKSAVVHVDAPSGNPPSSGLDRQLAEELPLIKKSLQDDLRSETARLTALLDRERRRNDELEAKMKELSKRLDASTEASSQAVQKTRTMATRTSNGSAPVPCLAGDKGVHAGRDADLKQPPGPARDSRSEAARGLEVEVAPTTNVSPAAPGIHSPQGGDLIMADSCELKALSAPDSVAVSRAKPYDGAWKDQQQPLAYLEEVKSESARLWSAMKKLEEQLAELTAALLPLRNFREAASEEKKMMVAEKEQKQFSDKALSSATACWEEDKLVAVVRQQVVGVEAKVHGKMQEIAQRFGAFLDVERRQRETIGEQTAETADRMVAIRREVNSLKADHGGSIDELRERVVRQSSELAMQQATLTVQQSGLVELRAKTQTLADELTLEVGSLRERWRELKLGELHKHVVEYMDSKLPDNLEWELRGLKSRMRKLEELAEGGGGGGAGTAKKRKLEKGPSAVVMEGRAKAAMEDREVEDVGRAEGGPGHEASRPKGAAGVGEEEAG